MELTEHGKRMAALMEEGKDPAAIAKELHMSLEDVHSSLVLVELAAGHKQPAPVAESRQEQPEEPDMVNHPPHYKQGKYECFDVIVALLGVEGAKAFCKGNIIKYRYRAAAKNGAEDIAKADRYMEMLKELEGGEHNAAD